MNRRLLAAAAGLLCASGAMAQNWSNNGGNAGRNGATPATGPTAATALWSGGRSSVIAWQPVTEGRRVFAVRQLGFPPEPNSDRSPIVAQNLDTGVELWSRNIPFRTGDWTTWIAGVNGGRVYASRSGNGNTVLAPLHALDAATGNTIWVSAEQQDAGAYDGVVFAPNGDLIVGSFRNIWRFRATDGTTAWRVTRSASVSSSCGVAINPARNAVYAADAIGGGHVIKRFNLTTGAFEYQSPVLPGFTLQNTPMVGPDGTIYLNRTQNNAAVDVFYAINDSGTALTVRWSRPAAWTVFSEFAATQESVFMLAPGGILRRLSALDGSTLAEAPAPIVSDQLAPRMAVDAAGKLYLSNGGFSNGRVFCFNPDLTERWSVPVANLNIGAPAIGELGTLIVAGISTNVAAYRTTAPPCIADCDSNSAVDINDFFCYLSRYAANDPRADIDGNGTVDINDFFGFLALYAAGC